MKQRPDKDPKTGHFLPGNQAARKHGALSNVPQERLRRAVRGAKAGWIADIGPTKKDLTTSQRILIDKAAFLLERTMCVEVWLRDHPETYGKMLSRGLRDTYLAWCNTLRLTLRELGIKERKGPQGMSEQEYVKMVEGKEDEKVSDDKAPDGGA